MDMIKVAKNRATEMLKVDEGYRLKPYYCTNKYPTIGYGTKIGPLNAPLDMYQFSMPEPAAAALLMATVDDVCAELMAKLPWFVRAPNVVQAVLICMAYQLGVQGLLNFKLTMSYLEARLYREASKEMLNSKWFRTDSPARAKRYSDLIASAA